MNPSIQIDALELLAMPSTENVFSDDFWCASGVANMEEREGSGLSAVAKAQKERDGKKEKKWEGGLTWVTNALDNVKARKYVDSRCVLFNKPLLESGTEGTKFNSQIIIPRQTESYDDGSADAPAGDGIPMCTLRNFPSTMVHCIEWARQIGFDGTFVGPWQDAGDYLSTTKPGANTKAPDGSSVGGKATAMAMEVEYDMIEDTEIRDELERFENVRMCLEDVLLVKQGGLAACATLALRLFYRYFNHAVRDLITQFPRDATTSSGKPFWKPPKRFPTIVKFDRHNDVHASFLVAATNMYAVACGLEELPLNGRHADGTEWNTFVPADSKSRDVLYLLSLLPTGPDGELQEPTYVPNRKKIESEEDDDDKNLKGKEEGEGEEEEEEDADKLMALLKPLIPMEESGELQSLRAQAADFEKDLDENFHIDYLHACANLRAEVYGIAQTTRHDVKMKAGRIIPAIATSTACATALVCMEIVKLVQEKNLPSYRNSSCNFAVSAFKFSTPTEVPMIEGKGEDTIKCTAVELEMAAKEGKVSERNDKDQKKKK